MERDRLDPVEQQPERQRKEKKKRKKSVGREILEWILTIAIAVGLALLIRTFIFEPVRVDGESMLNTLQDREYMIATKWDYLVGEPQRFDVVICHYPDPAKEGDVRRAGFFNGAENFVKRVIGLPGETVELRSGELYINDVLISQEFDKTPSVRSFGPYTVPQGEYLVMGDNRDRSHDSRDLERVGALPKDYIKGHVRCVVVPLKSMRMIESHRIEGPTQ